MTGVDVWCRRQEGIVEFYTLNYDFEGKYLVLEVVVVSRVVVIGGMEGFVVGRLRGELVQKSRLLRNRDVRHVVFLAEEAVHRHNSFYVSASTTQLPQSAIESMCEVYQQQGISLHIQRPIPWQS